MKPTVKLRWTLNRFEVLFPGNRLGAFQLAFYVQLAAPEARMELCAEHHEKGSQLFVDLHSSDDRTSIGAILNVSLARMNLPVITFREG